MAATVRRSNPSALKRLASAGRQQYARLARGQPSVNLGAGGTIVQNTLNDQHISNQTVINASSNAMSTIKGLNSMATISDAVTRGLTR